MLTSNREEPSVSDVGLPKELAGRIARPCLAGTRLQQPPAANTRFLRRDKKFQHSTEVEGHLVQSIQREIVASTEPRKACSVLCCRAVGHVGAF